MKVSNVFFEIKSHVPFAVVGSTDMVKVGNKLVRARQYPWGVVVGKFFFSRVFILNSDFFNIKFFLILFRS